MVVRIGNRVYEIQGTAYGAFPCWTLIRHAGRPMTRRNFMRLPDDEKQILFESVQRHVAEVVEQLSADFEINIARTAARAVG